MNKYLRAIKEFFSKYFTFKYVQIYVLIISSIVAVVLLPISIIDSNKKQKDSEFDLQIFLTQDKNSIYTNFTDFLTLVEKRIDIVLSFPENVKEFPQFWKESFNFLHEKHISIRIFTNNKNLKFDSFVEIRYLQTTKEFNSFYMNFAISDDINIFFPSTFYIDENSIEKDVPAYSYIVMLYELPSAAKELSALFNILWTTKTDKRTSLKHSFIPTNTTEKSFLFTINPLSEFAIGLPNITSLLSQSMSHTYSTKIILSHSIFPDLSKATSAKARVDLSRKSVFISSLFEASKDILFDQETHLLVPLNHFNQHKNEFLSMASNMNDNSTLICDDIDFKGTIIQSLSNKMNPLLLLPCGISNVFTGDMILGLYIIGDTTFGNDISNILNGNTKCKPLVKPEVII